MLLFVVVIVLLLLLLLFVCLFLLCVVFVFIVLFLLLVVFVIVIVCCCCLKAVSRSEHFALRLRKWTEAVEIDILKNFMNCAEVAQRGDSRAFAG